MSVERVNGFAALLTTPWSTVRVRKRAAKRHAKNQKAKKGGERPLLASATTIDEGADGEVAAV